MRHLIFLITALIFAGCGDNSAADRNAGNFSPKTTYSATASSDFTVEAMLHNLQSIYLAQAVAFNHAVGEFDTAVTALQATPGDGDAALTLKTEWKALMQAWKPVQANWGDRLSTTAFDIRSGCCNQISDFIDRSDSIENNPPTDSLPAVLNGVDVTSKITYTDIRLVEAILFEHDLNATVAGILADISTVWKEKSAQLVAHWEEDNAFVENADDTTVDAILNQFIDNMYKNKELRLGEPAGLTAASGGTADYTKLEYHRSGSSTASIIARIMGLKALYTGEYGEASSGIGFDDYLVSKGATAENRTILAAIDDAIAALEAIDGSLKTAITTDSEAVEAAYEKLVSLYSAVYTTLPAAMAIIPKIVEADGD